MLQPTFQALQQLPLVDISGIHIQRYRGDIVTGDQTIRFTPETGQLFTAYFSLHAE